MAVRVLDATPLITRQNASALAQARTATAEAWLCAPELAAVLLWDKRVMAVLKISCVLGSKKFSV